MKALASTQPRPARGFLDALCAALCLWAAAYHTPVGALARSLAARAVGGQSSARPLLAYYSAGVYDSAPSDAPKLLRANRSLESGPMPPEQALGYGAYAAMEALPVPERSAIFEAADAHALTRARVTDPQEGPRALAKLLSSMSSTLGSQEVALAALFCGADPARFARDRAKAEGHTPDLAALADELPARYADGIAAASQAAQLGTAYALGWPVPASTPITSPFGLRMHPILGVRKMHTGVDLGIAQGSEVRATADGVVRRASEDAVNGRVVILDHGRGVTTAYCHNSELLVTAGEHVHRGQVIARSGTTGRSTGPHVHYQLELGGRPVDPLAFRVEPARVEPRGLAVGGD